MQTDFGFGLEYDDFAASQGQRATDGKADDAGTDDYTFDLVGNVALLQSSGSAGYSTVDRNDDSGHVARCS